MAAPAAPQRSSPSPARPSPAAGPPRGTATVSGSAAQRARRPRPRHSSTPSRRRCQLPASVDAANVGSRFPDRHDAPAADSPVPWLPSRSPTGHYSIGEEKAMDRAVDGFEMTKVEGVLTSEAVRMAEMEMYSGKGKLRRLEGLAQVARKVEEEPQASCSSRNP
ncbi:unnamed protein product [Urochloa humidicola]